MFKGAYDETIVFTSPEIRSLASSKNFGNLCISPSDPPPLGHIPNYRIRGIDIWVQRSSCSLWFFHNYFSINKKLSIKIVFRPSNFCFEKWWKIQKLKCKKPLAREFIKTQKTKLHALRSLDRNWRDSRHLTTYLGCCVNNIGYALSRIRTHDRNHYPFSCATYVQGFD